MNAMKTTPIFFSQKTMFRISASFVVIFGGLFFSSCAEINNETNQNANSVNAVASKPAAEAKDTTEELAQLVKIPAFLGDVDAVWRIEAIGNSNDNQVSGQTKQKLRAVLQFYPDDAAKIVAEAEKVKPGSPVTIDNETWFPPELTGKGELSGDDTLKGIEYPANQFFQSPYLQGRLVRIEGTDYFLLELTTN